MASRENKNGGDFVLESRHLVGLFMLLVVIFGVVFTLGYLLGRSQYDSRLRAAVGPPPDADPPAASSALKSKGKPQSTGASSPPAGRAGTGSAPKQDATPSQKNSDWDFYHSAEPKTAEDHLQAAKKSVAAAPATAPLARQPADAKPAALAGEGRSSAASGKPAAVPPKPAAPPNNSAPAGVPLVANGAVMLQVAAVLHEGDAMALAQALQQKKFPAYVITPGTDKYYRVQVGPYADTLSATNARHDLEANGFKSIVKR
jgi:cell division septation protein DedD